MRDPIILPPTIRLSIAGLPSLTDRMLNGGLYALIAETPPARFPILASSLGDALREAIPCTVILPAQPELFIERIESFGQIDAQPLIAADKLRFFELQEDFAKKMFRFGADSFARELDHFRVPENSYLIFDQADELFSLHDVSLAMEQLGILTQWFGKRKVTGLLVFSRLSSAGASTLQVLMDKLAGICRIGGTNDGLTINFDYWQSGEGTIAAKNYRVHTLDSGLYKVAIHALPNDLPPIEDEGEDGEPQFFFMDPELANLAKQMQGAWRQIDTLVGMVHATRGTRSATVIFSFRRDTDLRQLAEAVHTLRLGLGRRARIVVHEKDASLRYQNEALLLRLGINLVVHQDVPASRLPLLLESLNGQIFDRDVHINFEAALASVIPSGLRGYLLPGRFVREAETILERAQTLNIPCALVIGLPARDTTVEDVLKHIRVSRPGDLITTDESACYLFLSGCPESGLLMTIERIFGKSIDASFDETRFLVRRHEIHAELAVLARAASRGHFPDYSSLAALREASVTPSNGVPAAAPRHVPQKQEMAMRSAPAQAAPSDDRLTPPDASPQAAAMPQIMVKTGRPRSTGETEPAAVIVHAAIDPLPLTDKPLDQTLGASTKTAAVPPRPLSTGTVNTAIFGKNEAPRATRAAQKK